MIVGFKRCRACNCEHYIKCLVRDVFTHDKENRRGDYLELCELSFLVKRTGWNHSVKVPHGLCPLEIEGNKGAVYDCMPPYELYLDAKWNPSDPGLLLMGPEFNKGNASLEPQNRDAVFDWLEKEFNEHRRRVSFVVISHHNLEDLEL